MNLDKSNVAYDLEYFEDSKVQIKSSKKFQNKTNSVRYMKGILFMIVGFMMVYALIYAQVMQSELNAKHNKVLKQIEQIKGENKRLEIELEKRLSFKNIEEIAINEYGLNKVGTHQIEYIDYKKSSKAEVIEQENFMDKVISFFTELF